MIANVEAETALVARLLVEPNSDLPALYPSDFADPDMRAIFGAMQKLQEEGKPVDVVTLRDEIGRDIRTPVLSLTPGHRAPVDAYVAAIKRDSFRRRYADRLADLIQQVKREDDPSSLLLALQEAEYELAQGVDIKDTLGRINLVEHQQEQPDPILGVLSPVGTTILYGDGGDGKGWVAARFVASLHEQGTNVAILDFEMQPKEWAYRLSKFGVELADIPYYSPPTTFDKWATERSARQLRDEGIEFLLVDSAMYASNVEDPYSPNGALAYGRARRRLDNLPALLLAHTTGNADKVFGSVFWRNECRISWRLNKNADTKQRHMICKKANGYSALEGQRLEIEFNEQHGVLKLHPHGQAWQAEEHF